MNPAILTTAPLDHGLMANAAGSASFDALLTETQACLRNARVPVLVESSSAHPRLVAVDDLSRTQRRWLGQVVLELYFCQLLGSDCAAVDLWPSRLGINADGDAVWYPRPIYVRWEPKFLTALRDFYAGFFFEDSERFERASGALGLGTASALLRSHLGEGNQRGVRFSAAELQDTLEALPEYRRPQDAPLHGNLMAFCRHVTSLHAHLESLGLAFDVRSAFVRSHTRTNADERRAS